MHGEYKVIWFLAACSPTGSLGSGIKSKSGTRDASQLVKRLSKMPEILGLIPLTE